VKRFSFSLLFVFLLLGIFAAGASAEESEHNKLLNPQVSVEPGNPNANATTSGIDTEDGSTFNQVIKSDGMRDNHGVAGDQKTHGSYQNNTNSCASCHQTHTSKARQLLFADSTYNTCVACHDGTLGFYNVFENGKEYFNSENTAGTFGGTHSGNMSVHLATGALKVSAAPGGNKTAAAQADTSSWGGNFTCASCHAPHGSYSSRLLHSNPANMGNTAPELGGNKAVKIDVVNYAERNLNVNAAAPKFKGVRGTKAEHGLTDSKYDSIPADAVVIMVYEKNSGNTAYTKSTNPWLYGYSSTSNGRNYQSRLFTVPANEIYVEDPATGKETATSVLKKDGTINNFPATADDAYHWSNKVIDQNDYQNGKAGAPVKFKYDQGLVYSATEAGKTLLNSANSADIGRGYTVQFDLQAVPGAVSNVVTTHNVESLWGSNSTGGVATSQWCSTCHTDYLFASNWNGAVSKNGNYNNQKYYGHTTNSASYTCLRCHYSHGTDIEIMEDADGATIHDLQKPTTELLGKGWTEQVAKEYMIDKNPSSALKKFTNLSGCWACHNSSKAASLKNTNRDELHPDGMIPDPSTKSYK
jgi:predicted CXXCH cytochrome family protein